MPIFAPVAAARLACALVAGGELASADALVAKAMAEATPVTRYDARLARAAVARGDPEAAGIAAEALSLAEAGGHLLSAVRLKELMDRAG